MSRVHVWIVGGSVEYLAGQPASQRGIDFFFPVSSSLPISVTRHPTVPNRILFGLFSIFVGAVFSSSIS
jgi:hypothetical protein